MALLQCDALHFAYGKQQILSGVDFALERGESVLLLGQNGEGKTTLMGCMLGMLRPDSGSVYRQQGMVMAGYLSSPAFMEEQTGRANLLYEAALRRSAGDAGRRSRCSDTGLLEHACQLVGLQPGELDKKVRRYSTGMRKKIAIARALMHTPDLLVLDEPASGLDPHGISELRSILLRLREQEGCAILVSSHQIAESAKQATRVAVLKAGRIVRTVPVQQHVGTTWRCSLAQPADAEQLQLIQRLGGDCIPEDRSQIRFIRTNGNAHPEHMASLLAELVTNGLPVVAFSPEVDSIENLFLETVSAS